MFMLNYVTPEKAEGEIAKAYGIYPESLGVPAPMQLLSVSPDLLRLQTASIGHFVSQEEIDHSLLAVIRYLVAQAFDYDYCREFNKGMLQAQGMTEPELETMRKNPLDGPFESNENALVAFVIKAVHDPLQITRKDIEELKDMGWSEKAILEATSHGAAMLTHGTLFKTFMERE
ncbi:carboxymuconolactone decarboxylase family protein [Salidesulfovibrio onnuriiensis]|uniref:carboxymuconolactone decarboxylase family protein n=1 Tax=Salidesulfovibrio onnuriiensis TaxID=2583823 RepID=UPI0011C7AFF9|nr:hypothetical protein [Salidesulfovibrio onnuriiensis]